MYCVADGRCVCEHVQTGRRHGPLGWIHMPAGDPHDRYPQTHLRIRMLLGALLDGANMILEILRGQLWLADVVDAVCDFDGTTWREGRDPLQISARAKRQRGPSASPTIVRAPEVEVTECTSVACIAGAVRSRSRSLERLAACRVWPAWQALRAPVHDPWSVWRRAFWAPRQWTNVTVTGLHTQVTES